MLLGKLETVWHFGPLDPSTRWARGLALFDTHVFLLNEYFIELNTANLKILNEFLK